ncbi:MAG: hypothetical protein TEF_18805 [Rhizobiales bacterium NRL2]|jgi:acyl-CoA synthetase (AMP-forming)/AMP-acid ligase II|nr:MAG: hypothetical protein TEF_18805 [Rhizobiales bacterium NRL2]
MRERAIGEDFEMWIEREPVTVCTYTDANALAMHNATAVQSLDERVTWNELHTRTNALARHLQEAGMRRGDRLALLVDSGVPFVELVLAALKAAISVVPLSPMQTRDVLARLINDAEVRAIAASPTHLETARELAASRGIGRPLTLVDRGEAEGFHSLESILRCGDASDLMTWPAPEDEFNVIYSSGTTGLPKGIVHTHESRLFNALGWGYRYQITRGSTMLLTTPPATNATWVNLIPTLLAGGRLVLLPKFDANHTLETMEAEGVTHTLLVPTQVKALMDVPDLERFDLSKLSCVVVGGSKFSRALKEQASQRLPDRLHEMYGTTECGSTVQYPNELPEKIESVGRPIFGAEFRVIDDDGHELPQSERGELVVRGTTMMKGYLNRPEANADIIWRDHRGRIFIRTGDVGRLDADGCVYVLDRKRDMIVTGGFNVFASDLEDVLREHRSVDDVAVVAAPHAKWGETPVALVIPAPGIVLDAEDLRAWANAQLGKYQRLGAVVVRRTPFPRNHLEKVLKRQLQSEYADEFSRLFPGS